MDPDAFNPDSVLHQATRLQIMTYLYVNRQAPLSRMREDLTLTPGNAATHLSRLSEAGYVEKRRVFVGIFEVHVFITEAGSRAFEAYVERLNAFVGRVRGSKERL
jgi:DNA-binding MarR family transcriptional regulator